MADAQTATGDTTFSRGCGGRVKRKWSGVELGTMIGGFIVFWPLGLLALGAKIVKGEMWPGAAENAAPWTAWKKTEGLAKDWDNKWQNRWHAHSATGNAAFDAYKKEQLDRLEAERRKLEEEQRAFGDYMRKLREARDKDEFDRFMAERAATKSE